MPEENSETTKNEKLMHQRLLWGDVRQERLSSPDTMFAVTGRKLYVIGDIDGGFRPRSNPYDLHTFGKPQDNDPLAYRLQGVWAQPVKALNRYHIVIESGADTWHLLEAERFTQSFSDVKFEYRRGTLSATRADFVPQDRPALFSTITLRNHGTQHIDIQLSFFACFDLRDAQFVTLADELNLGETVSVENNNLVARALQLPDKWAVAVGSLTQPADVQIITGEDGHLVGVLKFNSRLAPGEEQHWTIATVVEIESGAAAAAKNLAEWLPLRESLFSEKQSLYANLLTGGPRFICPDAHFNGAFDLARANMQALEAETRSLGRFFYAGLETFPFWFSADITYCTPGLMAAGLVSAAKNHLLLGRAFDESGSIPHQRSPGGEIVVNGNTAEIPLWVMAIWDTYRWTGDLAFLQAVYPAAVQGLMDYTLGSLDPDRDGYPSGPGLVERDDMGEETLDGAAYTWAALRALEKMAQVLGDTNTMARIHNTNPAARFDSDWWEPREGTYSMSLDGTDNSRLPVPHWAVVVPLEVGLASSEHAAITFNTLRAKYLNQWGLKHTVGDDERVWTLPTATLSRAAYRYGQKDLAFEMLQLLSATLDHGSIGMFHELIPEGLCFLQLWSGATFVRGVVEDLMGIHVRADLHAVRIAPQLPAGWEKAELANLNFGGHIISIQAAHASLSITHHSGPAPLAVTCQALDGSERSTLLAAGQSVQW